MIMTDSEKNDQLENQPRPDIRKKLFWDWRYADIDWNKTYRSVIERVLERGTKEEWKELIIFYGEPKVLKALKEEIVFLPDYIMDEVSSFFNLKKEDLACYSRKLLRKGHWI